MVVSCCFLRFVGSGKKFNTFIILGEESCMFALNIDQKVDNNAMDIYLEYKKRVQLHFCG